MTRAIETRFTPPTSTRDVRGPSRRAAFTVDGLCCAHEAQLIEDALGHHPDVARLDVDVVRHRLVVEGTLPVPEIERAVRALGMSARVEGGETAPLVPWWRRGRIVATAISGVALGMATALAWLGGSAGATVSLLALSTVAGGWYVVPRAVRAARQLALDMHVLMSIAALGAWIIGAHGEAAATLFLFAVAQLLETYSMDRARRAIAALMDLSPTEATVRRDGVEQRVPAEEVAVGETVVVRPGEKLPVDGIVTAGQSSVDQAPITGESMPVDKTAGADVFAGTLNGHGALEIRSTRPASDTTLARIVHAVEDAQAARAPSQTFVDRFARVYTPAVVAIAVLVAILPPLAGVGGWDVWIYRALAMLVIACPCALVISTPVSIVSALAAGARGGVLIKGGAHLESAGTVTIVVFDKTGTLTEGRPSLTDIFPLNGASEMDVLRLAAGVERYSEHPLARAVLAAAATNGIDVPASRDFEALVGRGARAVIDGEPCYVGNRRLALEFGAETPQADAILTRLEAEGKTAVVVMRDTALIGVIAIADRVRPEAAETIRALRAMGIRRIVMLTGDNDGTARAVAERLGIDEYRANLLPSDKVSAVRALVHEGERVAMIGDGVNDAPALAAATVGVAMGAAGTDVALETADIALMADNLSHLPFAVRLARATRAIVMQNIVFALAIKAVFLLLALGGWATLWMAVVADMGASLVVVANGLRALTVRQR